MTSIGAKAGGEHRHLKAARVGAPQRFTRVPGPEESAKAWAEYDRVTTEAWAEYVSITNKSAYLFERAIDPDTLPAYLRGIAGSFVEYRRVIARAEADLQRILAEADAQQMRFWPLRWRNLAVLQRSPEMPWRYPEAHHEDRGT